MKIRIKNTKESNFSKILGYRGGMQHEVDGNNMIIIIPDDEDVDQALRDLKREGFDAEIIN